MTKYVCDVRGWEYDPEAGVPEAGIEPGTPWENVPKADCVIVAVGHNEYRNMSMMQIKELFKD